MSTKAEWYILHVRSGSEFTAVENIKSVSEKHGVRKSFVDFNVPSIPPKIGSKARPKAICSGYVFAKIELSENTMAVIDEVSGRSLSNRMIIGFLPKTSGTPKPLSEAEYLTMIEKMTSVTDTSTNVTFLVGDKISVESGSYKGFKGIVSGVNKESSTLSLQIFIFGREASVNAPFSDVKKSTDN